jgi:hemolysin activation/secretion protein
VGGTSTLRGHRGERFAGDAAAYGSAELRQPLARVELVVRGTLGAFALADAGRVWFEGDSDGGWHTAVGGGLFFTFLDRAQTVSVAYARGEVARVHLEVGMPF